MEWKTIRVPESVYEDAKERKEEYGVTWGQYVNPHAWHSVFDAPNESTGDEITKATVPEDFEWSDEQIAELEDEINSLRRELDEFKHDVPGKVAEELQ